jgi:hypothetical protein
MKNIILTYEQFNMLGVAKKCKICRVDETTGVIIYKNKHPKPGELVFYKVEKPEYLYV